MSHAHNIVLLFQTAKLNEVDPQAWLADVLARLQDHPAKRIDDLLPWNWERHRPQKSGGVAAPNTIEVTSSVTGPAALTGCVRFRL